MGKEVPKGKGIGAGDKGFLPEQGSVPGREAEGAAQLWLRAGGHVEVLAEF